MIKPDIKAETSENVEFSKVRVAPKKAKIPVQMVVYSVLRFGVSPLLFP